MKVLDLKKISRKPKKIPYALLVHEISYNLWSSCERSFTPSILSVDKEVVYLWEIDVAINHITDFQEHSLVRTKQAMGPKIVPELMAEGLPERNSSCSSRPSKRSDDMGSFGSSFSCPSLNGKGTGKDQPCEVIATNASFPRASTRSDPNDGLGSHFPNPKVAASLDLI